MHTSFELQKNCVCVCVCVSASHSFLWRLVWSTASEQWSYSSTELNCWHYRTNTPYLISNAARRMTSHHPLLHPHLSSDSASTDLAGQCVDCTRLKRQLLCLPAHWAAETDFTTPRSQWAACECSHTCRCTACVTGGFQWRAHHRTRTVCRKETINMATLGAQYSCDSGDNGEYVSFVQPMRQIFGSSDVGWVSQNNRAA